MGKRATIVGTERVDVLRGTVKSDVIVGRGGGDRIVGRGGGDLLCGGGGNDKLFGQNGDDVLNGGAGTDSCYQADGGGSKLSCEGPLFNLTISKSGTGSGGVASSAAGIDCGSACSHAYPEAAEVTLTAAAASGSSFTGWGDSCSGTTPCTVRMSGPVSVTALFGLQGLPPPPLDPMIEQLVLSVIRAGNGTGSVTSSPAGLICGSTCSLGFDPGTAIVLTAVSGSGSLFSAWTGCDTTVAELCTVLLSSARTVTATFTLLSHDLTVALAGSGDGWVTSLPFGINCGLDCNAPYDFGTVVVLTPSSDTGSVFSGWSGACTGTGPCTVTINADRKVTASFARAFSLTVNRTGGGTGTITSSPSGISCGAECVASFETGTVVTLTAAPGGNALFSGWSGAGCSGTGACVVTMNAAKGVTATFVQTMLLTVTVNGAGAVTSLPSGISCGPDCSEPYAEDTLVTLTAIPNLLHVFVGWGGACTGILIPTCLVSMDAAKSVTATFL